MAFFRVPSVGRATSARVPLTDKTWSSLSEAERDAWLDTGFSEDIACKWLAVDAISSPAEADRWRDGLFSPEETVDWLQVAHVHTPIDAEQWRDSGFLASDAVSWATIEIAREPAPQYMDAIHAELWRDAGFSPSESAQWISFANIHIGEVGAAERWRDAGFTPREARPRILRGESAEDGRAGRQEGAGGGARSSQQQRQHEHDRAGHEQASSSQRRTPFDVLGVAVGASDAEIKSAYQHLARQFHPDAHPGASPTERHRYEEAMASINAAHDQIRDEPSRRSYETSASAHGRRADGLRSPKAGECDLCGYAPAAVLGFAYQVAWLLGGRRYGVQASLCRNCALALGRAQQNKTLYSGWWGIISFFTNFALIYRNARALRYASKWLTTPQRVSGVVAPMRQPASVGRAVARRGGFWFATALVLAVVGGGAAVAANHQAAPTFTVGNCVSGTGSSVQPVSCSDSHDGKIIDEVTTQTDCPASADGYVEDAGMILCIDSSQ